MNPNYQIDRELAEELATVFHKDPTDEETERGCEIIETLMRREKERRKQSV